MSKRCARWATKAALIGILIGAAACTKVDNELGDSLIPQDQQIHVAQMKATGIDAYQAKVDSIPAIFHSYGYVGRVFDPTFGMTQACWVGQFAPYWFSVEEKSFGQNPQVDSLVLLLTVNTSAHFGDTTVAQTFQIHELKTRYYQSSIYYTNRDISDEIDPEPLYTFEYKGHGNIQLRLTGEKADNLIKRLLDESGGVYEAGADSLFVNRFPGLCIIPAEGSPRNASTVPIVPSTSSLGLYTHRAVDAETDTAINVVYSFNPNDLALINFNLYQHDYTGSELEGVTRNATLPTSQTVALGYVQGSAGVSTYVRFTEEFIQTLKDKIQAPYRLMLINGAYLNVGIHNPTPETLDNAFNRLGSFSGYPSLTPIPDYEYMDELNQYNPITLPYDGYLNRTSNCYSFNITRFVQELIDAKEVKSRTYMLTPSYEELYGQAGVVLEMKPTAENPTPLTVTITYTLLQ